VFSDLLSNRVYILDSGHPLQVDSGVGQGSKVSPPLFNQIPDELIHEIVSVPLVYEDVPFPIIGFADDTNLCSIRPNTMQVFLNIASEWAERNGRLQFGFGNGKTALMLFNAARKSRAHLILQNTLVPAVNNYKYMGLNLSHSGHIKASWNLDDIKSFIPLFHSPFSLLIKRNLVYHHIISRCRYSLSLSNTPINGIQINWWKRLIHLAAGTFRRIPTEILANELRIPSLEILCTQEQCALLFRVAHSSWDIIKNLFITKSPALDPLFLAAHSLNFDYDSIVHSSPKALKKELKLRILNKAFPPHRPPLRSGLPPPPFLLPKYLSHRLGKFGLLFRTGISPDDVVPPSCFMCHRHKATPLHLLRCADIPLSQLYDLPVKEPRKSEQLLRSLRNLWKEFVSSLP
jgi:hypothetical protein